MEEQAQSESAPTQPTSVSPIPVKQNNKSLIIAFVLVFLLMASGLVYLGYQNYQLQKRLDQLLGQQISPSPTPTTGSPSPTQTTYTYKTFSLSYPQTWQASDSVTNSEFFSKNNLKGFDHMVLLQNGDYYLVVGIDTHKTGAEVGGIFTSDADYQDYLKNHDEVTITGKKFFLWKGDTRLSALTDPNREAGIYALASLSEYIPNKVTNEQNQTFNGFDDYIQNKSSYSYMFIKLSKNGNDITPLSIQAEIKGMLETIDW